jgi:anti-sigma factor RsiW
MTEHFSSPQWVDLVRGLLSEDMKTEMDQHLRADCEECREAFAAWSGFATFAEAEAGFEPPREAIRVTKTYLAQQHVRDGRTMTRRPRLQWTRPSMLATLVFDSLQTSPAGVRASREYSRHLLFAAHSMAIDLHIETASKAGWFLLAGQIADSNRPDQLPRRIDLSLVQGDTEISAFQTNEFGEFQCTFDRRSDLTLLFALEGGEVALPLDVLFTSSTSVTSSSTDSQRS